MPDCAKTPRIALSLLALAGLALAACGGDVTAEGDPGTASAPIGTYISTCDAAATIDFQEGGAAQVNENFCEGYGEQPWDYAVEGNILTMAPQGKLGASGIVQETFEIVGPSEIVLRSETSSITCGNCTKGDRWVAK